MSDEQPLPTGLAQSSHNDRHPESFRFPPF